MLREAVRTMAELSRKEALLFAPSSAAAQVLKSEGFATSDTVQQLMSNIADSLDSLEFSWRARMIISKKR
jgi:hypothetical protein